MFVHTDALDAKIEAYNTAHLAALDLCPRMLEALKPFVGTQVLKADGTLRKAVRDALPEIPSTVLLFGWYTTRAGYTLSANLKTCTSYKARTCEIACYAEISVYLGDLDRGVLKKLYEPQSWRTDYKRAEIEHTRMMLKTARNTISALESKLFPFGEYDR